MRPDSLESSDAGASARNIAAWDALYRSTPALVWGEQPVGFLPEFVRELAPLRPEDRILDAAAGEGRNLAALRRLGGRIYACDASASALRKIPAALRAGIELTVCELQALPFSDRFFRFALLSDVMETLPATDPPLQELARVLVPGGLLLCNIPDVDDGIAGIDMEPLGGGRHLYRGRYFYHFYSEQEARALLERHGLRVVRTRTCRWQDDPHPNFRPSVHFHLSRVFLAERVG